MVLRLSDGRIGRGRASAAIEEEMYGSLDGALDLGAVRRGTEPEYDAQVEVVADHPIKVLGGEPAVGEVECAPSHILGEDVREVAGDTAGTDVEERRGELREASSLGDDRAIERQRDRVDQQAEVASSVLHQHRLDRLAVRLR